MELFEELLTIFRLLVTEFAFPCFIIWMIISVGKSMVSFRTLLTRHIQVSEETLKCLVIQRVTTEKIFQ